MIKESILALAGILIISSLFIGCNATCLFGGVEGSGNIISQERNVDEFNTILLSGAADVYIKQGEQQSLKIETDDNILPLVKTEVSRGELRIKTEGSLSYKKLNIYVTIKDIKGFALHGSGDIYLEGPIKSDNFNLQIQGSGNLVCKSELAVNDLKMDISGSGDVSVSKLIGKNIAIRINGSGDVKMSGKAESASIAINGSGDVKIGALELENCSIESNGSGDCQINVKSNLKANLNGSGDVVYSGFPKNVAVSTHGSGEVKKIDK